MHRRQTTGRLIHISFALPIPSLSVKLFTSHISFVPIYLWYRSTCPSVFVTYLKHTYKWVKCSTTVSKFRRCSVKIISRMFVYKTNKRGRRIIIQFWSAIWFERVLIWRFKYYLIMNIKYKTLNGSGSLPTLAVISCTGLEEKHP